MDINLYKSKTYTDELDYIVKQFGFWKDLDQKAILITGSGGLICSGIVDLLLKANEILGINIHIFAAGRDENKIKKRFKKYIDKENFSFVPYDARNIHNDLPCADYIIHGASNAYPAVFMKNPIETMLNNFCGLNELLLNAVHNQTNTVVFISSSEIYGRQNGTTPIKENEYGYIDILNPRSAYAAGKMAAETLCISYQKEYDLRTIIMRPGHIYGPTASEKDNRVSSDFAYKAARGEKIILKSDGSQIRSYCHVFDAATAILYAMLYGKQGNAYNISNPDSIISIREMAELMAAAGTVDVVYDVPDVSEKAGFNPMSNSSLDSEKILKLGWKGIFDAKRGITETVRVLKEVL